MHTLVRSRSPSVHADVCCAIDAVVVLTGCATPHMMGDMWMPGESMEVSCVRAEYA